MLADDAVARVLIRRGASQTWAASLRRRPASDRRSLASACSAYALAARGGEVAEPAVVVIAGVDERARAITSRRSPSTPAIAAARAPESARRSCRPLWLEK